MCGLVGAMGFPLDTPSEKVFNTLIYLDAVRGDDSTGVALVKHDYKNGNVCELYKSLGGPTNLFLEHGKGQKNKTLSFGFINVLLGHNRFKTQGEVSIDNAHPFEFENLIGAHNGTVSLSSLSNFHNPEKFNLDSKIIFSQLNQSRDINTVWKDADGAMALVWWDKVDNSLNMIRNKERELYVAYSTDDKYIYWASEEWMLYVACSRSGVKIKEPFLLDHNNKLYTFTGDKTKIHHEVVDVNPFEKKPYIQHGHGYRGAYGGAWDNEDSYWEWWDKQYQQGQKNKAKEDKKETKSSRPPRIVGKTFQKFFHITQFIDNPHVPSAWGKTLDGEFEIHITIPPSEYEAAKKKIIGSQGQGWYKSSECWQSLSKDFDFCVNWHSVQWVKKKTGTIISHKDHAPWFAEGMFLTKPAYLERVSDHGCDCCRMVPEWEEREDLLWISREVFYCKECKDLDFVKEYIKEHSTKKAV